MKKLALVFCLIISSLFLFAGCGYSGSITPVSISFVSENFYVDLNIPCSLDYKVLPSSARGATLTFEAIADYDYSTYFDFNASTGTIVVRDNRFEEIKVLLRCGDLTDECMVYLKQYPTSIEFEESLNYLSAGSMAELVCNGLFGSDTRAINNSYYNVSLVSSDPTVVSIEDANRFLVKATGKQGTCTITAKLVDVNGNAILVSSGGHLVEVETQTTVSVVGNVESALVVIDNNFIRNLDAEINIQSSINDQFEIQAYFMDKDDFLIENIETIIISLNTDVATIVKSENKTYLKIVGGGTAEIVITSNGYDSNGDMVVFRICCQISVE